MKIKMTLLSDAIFGNGISVPGEEDISVQIDENGFPYYKGGTFKGIFREELIRYLNFTGEANADEKADALLGFGGNDTATEQLVFSDFTLSPWVREQVLAEFGASGGADIRDAMTHIRTFTKMNENGMVAEESLRMARCVNKGLVFYSEITGIHEEDQDLVKNVLGLIKWIGTMRNRGFGKVRIEEVSA